MTRAALTAALLLLLPSMASADEALGINRAQTFKISRNVKHDANGNIIGGRPAGCPHAYCGCGLRKYLGIDDKSLDLANNWLRFPRSVAAPGRVAVWPNRHVALIEQVGENGQAYLRDWNSGGGLTRLHWRDISRAVIVDPYASRVASR